ncbi:MAG: FAD-dependent thymidylate synthase [Rhodospirillales bacterium]
MTDAPKIRTDEPSRAESDMNDPAQSTRRAVAPALEAILYDPLPVLDHGFVRVIDYMGDDAAVVQAARVSYGRGTKRVQEDRGLIRYLLRHRHTSPFEMCEIKLHVKLPIFVARQWIRHRTANVNEYSARYSILDREFYLPDGEQLAVQSSSNRQGRGDRLSADEATAVQARLAAGTSRAYADYQWLLGAEESEEPEGPGLARELARMVLPISAYTQWYWKVDLHNLLSFLSLRADPHAQYEIRVYADLLMDLVRRWVPLTAEAFEDYRMGATSLSRQGLAVVQRLLAGEEVTQANSGLTAREWRELMESLGREA